MSDETTLLPCPFCGGEAHVLKDGLPYVVIECERCFCRTNCNVTEAEAIAAWNNRAELTCRNKQKDVGMFECSECGISGITIKSYGLARVEPARCPNCGAKVVGK